MCIGLGGGDGGAGEARAEEMARQGRIKTGTDQINTNFAGFDDKFYLERENATVDFLLPQLNEQKADATRRLIYSLANAGQLNSSTRGKRFARLDREDARARLAVADRGRQAGNAARSAVESARSNLIQILTATADPGAAASSAAARQQQLALAPTVGPLGAAFTDIAFGIGQGIEARRDGNTNFGARLFAPSSGGSSRIVA